MRSELRTTASRRARGLRTGLAPALLGVSSLAWAADTRGPAPEQPTQFRLGFSIGTIGEFNRNDAKGSSLVWGKMILSLDRARALVAGQARLRRMKEAKARVSILPSESFTP